MLKEKPSVAYKLGQLVIEFGKNIFSDNKKLFYNV